MNKSYLFKYNIYNLQMFGILSYKKNGEAGLCGSKMVFEMSYK